MKWKPCGIFNVNYKQELSIIRIRFHWTTFIVLIVLVHLIPFIVTLNLLDFFIRTIITLIIVLGLELIVGYCGQISLGHAAFACVGAFSGGIFLNLGIPYLLALFFSGIVAGLAGFLFAIPAIRVKGLYLAFSTLAAHFILMFVLIHYAGGMSGYEVKPPIIFGLRLNSDLYIYFLVLEILIILTYAMKNLSRSKAGRAFVAVRDHDIAANTLGVNVFAYKLLAFGISCFYAGVGGLLWVTYLQWASVEHFTLWQAIWYVGILVIWGMGTIEGVFFGTLFMQGLNEMCDVAAPIISQAFPIFGGTVISALPLITSSICVIAFLIFEPRGLAHTWRIILNSTRLYPFTY